MDLQEALETADGAVFRSEGRHLKDIEKHLLLGALEGKTYEQIAKSSNFAISYLKKYAGPNLWKTLSRALGEEVRKTNFEGAIERYTKRHPSHLHTLSFQPTESLYSDWERVPDVGQFIGRETDLTILHQWVLSQQCRLILLSGMGGVGKTMLAAKLASQVRTHFERTVWRSLRKAPPIRELLDDLISLLSNGQEGVSALPIGNQISRLLYHLQNRRHLLVLDELETVLKSGELAGQYDENHVEYEELIKRIGEEAHGSCIILASREQPKTINMVANDKFPVRVYTVEGLSTTDAKNFLASRGIDHHQHGVEELVQIYRGNPSALGIVSTTIQRLFRGKVTDFLKLSTIVVNDVLDDLLCQQFERLSVTEQEILYWISLQLKPVSFEDIKLGAKFITSRSSDLIGALESLERRSFLEKNDDLFLLQPIVSKYTINDFVMRVCRNITHLIEDDSLTHLGLLRSHDISCSKADEMDKLQLILRPIVNRLAVRQTIGEQLKRVLSLVRGKPFQMVGYSEANIKSLLSSINS